MNEIQLGLIIGVSCLVMGLYIRDKSILIKDNGKWCFKLVKTSDLKRK